MTVRHPPTPPPGELARARALVRESWRILVLTGAGISTDSGIPDFRGPGGVWTKDPEAQKLSTLHHYVADADVRRRAWQLRLAASRRQALPNDGHRALVGLEHQGRLRLLVTQNVDGLHGDAGHDPALVVEIHGTNRQVTCLRCGDRQPASAVLARVAAGEDDPTCRARSAAGNVCGGILKSATVSFGQQLVESDLQRAERAALSCDLVLAVGTTLSVYPAAGLVPAATQHGARLIIVNGSRTELDDLADAVVRGPISEVLPEIVTAERAPGET